MRQLAKARPTLLRHGCRQRRAKLGRSLEMTVVLSTFKAPLSHTPLLEAVTGSDKQQRNGQRSTALFSQMGATCLENNALRLTLRARVDS